MSGTLENTNNNIIKKINAIINLLKLFKTNCVEFNQKTYTDIYKLKEDYEMGSINILSDYFFISNQYQHASDTELKCKLLKDKDLQFKKYKNFIRKENFISKLDRIINLVKTHIQKNSFDKNFLRGVYALIKIYNDSTVNKKIKEAVYEICVCSFKMDIDPTTSTLICKKCGVVKKLYGTVFEDDQFYFQEGQRTKHGTYDPSKHCRIWVERIQARETTEIPETVINKIRQCIKADQIKNINHINCNQIRKYLRYTHNSKYNEHVPLIRKLITGITPPQLTDYEMQLIHIYFDKVMRIFDEIKSPGKTNCPYHPYFIYKIIEQIINSDSDRVRKAKILSCIHLQSRETLILNDHIFKPICERIPEFVYKPTDRNKTDDYF